MPGSKWDFTMTSPAIPESRCKNDNGFFAACCRCIRVGGCSRNVALHGVESGVSQFVRKGGGTDGPEFCIFVQNKFTSKGADRF